MGQEFYYTSAPNGLLPGTQGFCTVAATKGMSASLLEKLESLTGYKPLFTPNDPNAAMNPVAYLHVALTAGGRKVHVVGRVGASGLDYTGRTNKFAHLVVLEGDELPQAGPAWLMQQPGFLKETWQGPPRYLESPPRIPRGTVTPGVCRRWQETTGDAGWGGALVEMFLSNPEMPVYLAFEPGQDTLPLLAESIALLPPEERWSIGFTTYYTNLPTGVECPWRCIPVDSAEAKAAHRSSPSRTWTLTSELGRAKDGELVERARSGKSSSTPQRKKEAFPVAVESKHEPSHNAVVDNRKRLRLDDLADKNERDEEEREPRALQPEDAGRRSGLMFFAGIFLGVLLMTACFLGLEWILKSSVLESIGIVTKIPPLVLSESNSAQTDDRAKELERAIEDASEKQKQIRHLQFKNGELEAKSNETDELIQKTKAELQRLKENLEKAEQAVSKIAGELEEKKRAYNEQSKTLANLRSELTESKKIQPIRVSNKDRPRNRKIAIFADLIPPYLNEITDPENPDRNKKSVNLELMLGATAKIELDFQVLEQTPKTEIKSLGGTMKWRADKNNLEILFGVEVPKTVAQFNLNKNKLHFEWMNLPENEDLIAVRRIIQQSVLVIKADGVPNYIFFQNRPVTLDLTAQRKDEVRIEKSNHAKRVCTYSIEKSFHPVRKTELKNLQLTDVAIVIDGQQIPMSGSQDLKRDLRLQMMPDLIECKLLVEQRKDGFVMIFDVVCSGPSYPEPQPLSDKATDAEKKAHKTAKESYDNPPATKSIDPLPRIETLKLVSKNNDGVLIPLVVIGN